MTLTDSRQEFEDLKQSLAPVLTRAHYRRMDAKTRSAQGARDLDELLQRYTGIGRVANSRRCCTDGRRRYGRCRRDLGGQHSLGR